MIGTRAVAKREAIAIARDGTWAHAYPAVSELLQDIHNNVGTGAGRTMEAFDVTGRRLLPVLDRDQRLMGLRASIAAPDPSEVHRRLVAVLRHITQLHWHSEVAARAGTVPMGGAAVLPDLDGHDLREHFAVFSHQFLPRPHTRAWWQPRVVAHAHSGGWMHNAFHAAGWTH